MAGSGVDRLRRALLMLVTALVVARPLVLGEDPGLSAAASDNGSMVLSLLWLVTGVAWAAWRLKANRGEWYVGVVEAGLGVAVVLFFAGAETAACKHPARLIAWEWLVLFVGFVVVRHLAATADARQGLFAAFLATGLMVSAHGVYQAVVEVPEQRKWTPEKLRELFAQQGMQFDDANFEVQYRRVQDGHAFGTFAHPNSYAGYLALLLPGLVGAVVVCLRNKADVQVTRLAATAALVGVAALWVTHSRGALLAVTAVGVGTAAAVWRRQLLAHRGLAIGAAAGAAAGAAGLFFSGVLGSAFGKDSGTMAARLDYWRATAKMIGERPWFGVGSGNFGGYYPRYMAETAGEKIKDPHNFVLELWATGGVFLLLAVLAALAAFFVSVRRGLAAETHPPAPSPARGGGDNISLLPSQGRGPGGEVAPLGRGEFYAGGVIGLLLAFALRMMTLHDPDAILQEGLASAARSLVWFLGFALFERVAWTDRQRAIALTAGVVALLLNLGVSGGIGYPSVAGPLWFAAALALASVPPAPRVFPRAPLPSLVLPFPALAVVAVLYVVFCFYPISSSLSLLRTAERNGSFFQINRIMQPALAARAVGLCVGPQPPEMCWTAAMVLVVQHPQMRNWADEAPQLLSPAVLAPLGEAALDDPDNPRVWIRLGFWYLQGSELTPVPEKDRVQVEKARKQRSEKARLALNALHQAQKLDPNGVEPLQAEVQLELTFARNHSIEAEAARRTREAVRADPKLKSDERERRQKVIEELEKQSRTWAAEYLTKAVTPLRKAVELDPTEAPLRYQLAELLNRVGDDAGCRREAQKALHLDDVSTLPPRKLTAPQRSQAEAWATASSDR